MARNSTYQVHLFYVQCIFGQLFKRQKSRITFRIDWINTAAAWSISCQLSYWRCFPRYCQFQVNSFVR